MLNILLVDDDANLGPATRDTLNFFGHRAVLATNLAQAYAELDRPHAFNVMLLDLELGAETGEMLIGRLRDAGIEFPLVVILSAQPRNELERAAKAIDAADILQKPSSLRQINETLDRLMAA